MKTEFVQCPRCGEICPAREEIDRCPRCGCDLKQQQSLLARRDADARDAG